MTIEVYKKLNEELINKVQELKGQVFCLEKQIVAVNANLFEEVEKRIDCEKKCLRIVSNLKNAMNQKFYNAFCELKGEDEPVTPPVRPRSLTGMLNRRSSMGVVTRSPMKNTSPQQNFLTSPPQPIIEEAGITSNESDAQNLWGLSNLQEESGNKNSNITENTEKECRSSSCQSIDTTSNSSKAVTQNNKSYTIIPSININNRRGTHLWNNDAFPPRSKSPEITIDSPNSEPNTSIHERLTVERVNLNKKQRSPKVATAIGNENICNNSLDRLTADFSENLILHSTPRNIETIDTANENTTVTQNQTDDSGTSMISSRPRRHCAPKTLVERGLHSKLRNEAVGNHQTKKKKKK